MFKLSRLKTKIKRYLIRFKEKPVLSFSRWLYLGILIGIVAGIGAIVFNASIRFFRYIFLNKLAGYYSPRPELLGQTGAPAHAYFIHWLILFIPALGGVIAGFLVYLFAPEAEGHGTDAAIKAFHENDGYIRGRVPIIKLFASSITLGSGGSGGREGPVAQIGAGFGSFLATKLKLPVPDRRMMLVAGIGAGIGAIFKAPLAGAMFSVEVLYSGMDFESSSLLLSIIASIIAYSIYCYFYAGFKPILTVSPHNFDKPVLLIFYGLLGFILAVFGYFYIRFFYFIHSAFKKLNIKNYFKPAIGGLFVGVIGYFLPGVLGVGYGWLQLAILEKLGIILMLLVAVFKIIATSFTIGSGGSAGVYAPSLVIGGMLGGAAGMIFHILFPYIVANSVIPTFVLMGMAGFFAGAAKTPISSLIMVTEITAGYSLLPPLMLVSAITFMASGKKSIYISQKQNKIESPAHFKDYYIQPLKRFSVKDIITNENYIKPINENAPLYEVIKVALNSNFNVFPVINDKNKIIGIIRYQKVNDTLLTSPDSSLTAKDMMDPTGVPGVLLNDTLDIAVHKFFAKKTDNLIIFDPNSYEYTGILRKNDVLKAMEEK